MRTRASFSVVLAVGVLLAVPAGHAATLQQLADRAVVLLLDQSAAAALAQRLTDAQARVDEAMALAERIGDRTGLAMAQRQQCFVMRLSGRPRDASGWCLRALASFEALGNKSGTADVLQGLVAVAALLPDLKMAREYGDRALELFGELGDDRGRGRLLVQLVFVGDAPALRDSRTLEIIRIARQTGDASLLGEGLMLQAGREFASGDYHASQRSHEEAIAAIARTPNVRALATAYLSLGRVFRAHGDYLGALDRYRKVIDLLAPTEERYVIVEATNASAIALGLLDRHAESLAMYEKGLALARESGNTRLIDFMEGNLAGGLLAAEQYERAIPALEAAIAKKPEPGLLAYRQNSLAIALTRVGREKEAMGLIDEAVRYSREMKLTDLLAARLDTRAWILTRLGRMDEALADGRETLALMEQVRSRLVPSDFLKQGYGDRIQRSYQRLVDVMSRLGHGPEALAAAEQGRARAFLDLLAARESPEVDLATRGAAPATPALSPAGLASDAMGQALDMAGIQGIADRLRSTLVAYWVNEDATLIWVVRPGAEPIHVRVSIPREKVARLVAATTAPLRETSPAAVTRGAVVVADGPPQATVDDLAALPMRGLGLAALARDDRASWLELDKSLIEPVRAHLPARGARVTIVPHGPLLQLSFAALRNAAGRYLIEDYELNYAPAISVLAYTGRRQQSVAENRAGPWALVGNPATLPTVGDRALAPLPGASRELAAVAAIAPRPGMVRLEGASADEAAVLRAIATSRPALLHFATHGFVFDDGRTSFLALNRRGTSAADDGRLMLDEVYGLRLETDLVVLSACRTGSGQVSSDGVMGLTRGFFYAGSPSVLATYWDITDETTASLMSAFYRNYVKARAKGASLRAAQLALLADLRAGKVVVTVSGRRITLPEHPLLWAAFFLSGEP